MEAANEQVHGDQTASLVADLESQLRKLDVRPNIRRKVRNYAEAQSSLKPAVTPPGKPAEAAGDPVNSQELIAFLAANPLGTPRLLLDEECAAIERELSMTAARDVFAVRSKWTVTVDEMMRHLATLTPAVIHFSGHGRAGTLTDHGEGSRQVHRDIAADVHGGIYLEDEHRQPHCVGGRALAQMIASTAPCARIVVLNACYSDALAGALCDAVDCVVGMQGAVEDTAARSFAIAFYRALGNRSSVANAVRQAAAALAAKHPSSEHLPICRTRDGVSAEHLIPAAGSRTRTLGVRGVRSHDATA